MGSELAWGACYLHMPLRSTYREFAESWGSIKFMSLLPSFLWLDCGRTSWLLHMWKDFRGTGCYSEHCWNTQSWTWKLGKYRLVCAILVFRRYYTWQNIYLKMPWNVFIDFRFYPDTAGEREEHWSNSNIHFFIIILVRTSKEQRKQRFFRLARGRRVVIILVLPNSSQGKECFEDAVSCKCDVTSKLK